MVQVEHLVGEREHAQVHHVARAAYRAELDELDPVVRAPDPVPYACVEPQLGSRRGRRGLVWHAAHQDRAKWSSTMGVTSAIVHWSGALPDGGSTPHMSSAACESPRCSDPWLPPPM